MIILFLLMIIIGFVHTLIFYRKGKTITHLDILTTEETTRISEKIRGYTYGRAISDFWKEFYRHLKGKDNATTLRHLVIVFIALVAGTIVNQQFFQFPYAVVIPGILFFSIYTIYLQSKKRARQDFEAGFAEALNIIGGAVGAGNSLLNGIEQSGLKVSGIVGEEFTLISQRLEIGEDVESVFMDSYERLFYREYFFFVIAVLINMRGGGEVKEIVNRLSKLISNARIMERQKLAKTAEPRASIKILMMIPAGFFFFLKFLSPENFDVLLHDPTGQMLLYYCIASELLGLFWVWTMINKI